MVDGQGCRLGGWGESMDSTDQLLRLVPERLHGGEMGEEL